MPLAFIDYESFWDVGYSLRQQKLSYTDYIHDPRFELHGAAVARNDEEPIWLRGEDLRHWVTESQKAHCTLTGHNMLFDGYVTRHVYQAEFPMYFCTMAMLDALFQGAVGRGLDEAMTSLLGWDAGKDDILTRTKGRHWHEFTQEEQNDMARYACADLKATQQLYYRYATHLPVAEHQVMSLILSMFCRPRLQFDEETLMRALANAHDDRDSRIEKALAYFDCTEDDLRKDKRFLGMLSTCGVRTPYKPSPSNPDKMIPALAKTDQGFIDLLEHDDPRVAALAEGRLAVKSTQGITRAQRFVDLHKTVGYLPVAYNYYRAHTGRVSGGNKINLANLKRGSDLRKSIVAPPGYVLGVADSSQIEARDVSYLAGNEYMLGLFRRKEDPYNAMASEIFGRPIDRKNNPADEVEGFIGKTAVLGLGFQMGGPKFRWTAQMGAKVQLGKDLEVSLEEAYRVVDVYRKTNWKIVEFWEAAQRMLVAMANDLEPYDYHYEGGKLEVDTKGNKIWFPNGTYLFFPCLSYDEGSFTYVTRLGKNYVNKYIYGGKLVENIVQKHARDIVTWQMLNIAERYPVVLHTYDENVALLPESEVDEGMQWMIEQMKTPPPWAPGIPLDAEGGYAKEYSK